MSLVIKLGVWPRSPAATERSSSAMELTELKKYREILERKRDEILTSTPARTPATEPGWRSGDWIDQSSQESDVHVRFALKKPDSKLLRAI